LNGAALAVLTVRISLGGFTATPTESNANVMLALLWTSQGASSFSSICSSCPDPTLRGSGPILHPSSPGRVAVTTTGESLMFVNYWL
jgi:hypothetical protein